MIPVLEPSIGKEEIRSVLKAVKSGWVSSKGEFIEKFEKKFADYHRVKEAVSTSNGTTALHLALKSLGIEKNDEVIVPVLTFAATANAVIYCNAKPVFVDIHPKYWCIDPQKIEEKITEKTRAIIPVHLYGHPCDMDWITDIAEDHGLYVVEDAAESHGAEYKGKKVGTFGDIACFSFYGNKIITTGEGGMCITNNEELAKEMRILRDHGMRPDKKYWHDKIGFNYRMTNLQAALGIVQLKKLDKFINKKRKIAKIYRKNLYEFQEKKEIELHPEMSWAKCVYWTYSILIKNKPRDELIEYLYHKSVDTRPFFYPLNIMPPYKKEEKHPNAYKISKEGLNLPSSININKETIIHICDLIREFLK